MDERVRAELMRAQEGEITEHHIYARLAARAAQGKAPENARILARIGADEKRHHDLLKAHTGADAQPVRGRVAWYTLLARLFGVTFALRLMEQGEEAAQVNYAGYADTLPDVAALAAEEEEHEQALIGMLEDERLTYASSVVLGLNDALVELTGAIAGFTLALRDTSLIAVVALITGISAALSMGASEYLATRHEAPSEPGEDSEAKHPLKASVYTGGAYVVAVIALVSPFFIFDALFLALGCTLGAALLLILAFTYYISVARGESFRRSALEMVLISMGVAGVSFLIGLAVHKFLGVDV